MEWDLPKDGNLRLQGYAAVFFLTIASAIASPIPTVRVMVDRNDGMSVEGFDVLVSDARTGRMIAREDRRAKLPISCSLGSRITLKRRGIASHYDSPLKIESLGGFLRVDGKQFRDALYVYSFNGDCVVVNHVDIEKYVAGVLHSEMNAGWNIETLKAQAIAARTYAIYQMKEAGTSRWKKSRPPFDLDSTVKDQVYEGAHQERYKAVRAVEATRGVVLTFKGAPIKAFYHSTCGGRTETAERVWGAKYPCTSSVSCGFCDNSPRAKWSYEVNERELVARLKRAGLLQGDLLSIRVATRTLLGRVDRIEIRDTAGTRAVPASKLREALGPTNLFSTDFKLSAVSGTAGGSKYVFSGRGSGHGVGMCQWGAKTMGEKGISYTQILKRYYADADLTKIW